MTDYQVKTELEITLRNSSSNVKDHIHQLEKDSDMLHLFMSGDQYENGEVIALVGESIMHFLAYEINAYDDNDVRERKAGVLIDFFTSLVNANRYMNKK